MPGEDRLEKMRAMAAAAKAEQENKAKETAERARGEQEGKGAERAEVEQALAGATAEVERLTADLVSAEALVADMADIPAETRAPFDAELAALRTEAEAARTKLEELNTRKIALGTELKTDQPVPEATIPTETAAPKETKPDFLPGTSLDNFLTPDGRYFGSMFNQKERSKLDPKLDQILSLYKTGTLREVAWAREHTVPAAALGEPPENAAVAQLHVELWKQRVGKLKPEFQKPFSESPGIALNMLRATRKELVVYKRVVAEELGKMEARKKQLETTPKDEQGGAWIGHMQFAETRLKELNAQTQMFATIEQTPGYLDLTDQLAQTKDAGARKKIESQIEALISQ